MFNDKARDPANAVQDLITETERYKKMSVEKQWKYQKNGSTMYVSDCAERLLTGLNQYAKIVDVGIQGNPNGAALVWAGMRFILQTVTRDVEMLAEVITCLENFTRMLNKCAIH